ncbi:hypothetical protein AYX14_06962 [Cryptococcus neoformans]|nr:hypothetical protein AYX14_06962 [Cryptococcus neoformans var. grubii]
MSPTALAQPPLASIGVQPPTPAKSSTVNPPVADDYLYELNFDKPLPTLERYKDFGKDVDTTEVANDLLSQLSKGNADSFANLFIEEGAWRDKIVFTWEYRTFNGPESILKAASDLFPTTPVKNFRLLDPAPAVARPYPDLAFLQVHFAFDTDVVGASGVANLVNTDAGAKLWTLHTVIESLHGYPELPNRDGHMIGLESWSEQRKQDTDAVQPQVVIVGAGHNGLMMAARFKALGVDAVIIERNARIGDNWRNRYEALSLHFPHWADHFPYMPYPDHWPIYTPAAKLGDWLEWYASAMELHVWTNTSVVGAKQEADGSWQIEVERGGQRQVLEPKHVVLAVSLAGNPLIPDTPGINQYTRAIRHSSTHDSSREWVGKKVLVVGTSSSGFDTVYDFARRGIDTTFLQRSPTYVMSLTNSVRKIIGVYEPQNGTRPNLDAADRTAFAFPLGPAEELGRRLAVELENLDQDLIAGMEDAGFKTWRGQRGTGTQTLGSTKGGGFYFDAGACEQIIKRKVKVEQGWIDHFTEDTVVLNGGRERQYDLVVLATGFTNTIDSVRNILGDEVANRCNPIWGVDKEGEIRSAWKDCGVPNLWIMIGTLQNGRYHSKRVSLRIKAMLEGVARPSYSK